jgi:hypothetical protein
MRREKRKSMARRPASEPRAMPTIVPVERVFGAGMGVGVLEGEEVGAAVGTAEERVLGAAVGVGEEVGDGGAEVTVVRETLESCVVLEEPSDED